MAGRKLHISATGIVIATGAQNVAFIKPATNIPVKINRLTFGPAGTSNAADRIKYALYRGATATAGAAMSIVQKGGHSKGVGAIQTTASTAPTSVTAGTNIVKRGIFLPNSPVEIPLDIDLDANEGLLLATDTPTSATVEIGFDAEE